MLRLMPILYVKDVAQSAAFYRSLGLVPGTTPPSQHWAELHCGGASLGIHLDDAPAAPTRSMALGMVALEPLESLVKKLTAANISLHRNIADEAFGRSLQVLDPDGNISEHDPEFYE